MAAIAAAAGCDLGTGTSDPSDVAIVPAYVGFDALGAMQQLSAEVRNEDGDLLPGEAVAWEIADAAVARISATGVVTAVANGETVATASSGGISRSIVVEVFQRAATLQKASGEAQPGTSGHALAEPVVVRALDRGNNPASGVLVTFEIAEGGGTISPDQVETDSDGLASATWTLGTEAGEVQRARAFVSYRVGAAVDFTAIAAAGPPAMATVVSGDDQSGPRGTTLLAPVVVRVADEFDNPVTGVSVAYSVTSGGGSFPTTPVMTDAQGLASASWTLGSTLGGQTGAVTVSILPPMPLDAFATEVPDEAIVLAGDGQTGIVGERLPVAPAVRVLDASDNPIASLDVRFSALGGSLEPLVGAVSESLVVRTDANGVATVRAWILGAAPGAYDVVAVVPGLSDVVLTATAQTGPPTAVVKVSGDGQRGPAGAPLPQPLVARVTDRFGNPVSGQTVSFTPASQSGSVQPTQGVTDADGLASTVWTLSSSTAAQFVTASIPGATVVFSGGLTGLGGLEIELHHIDPPTASQLTLFDSALERWAAVLPGRLTPQPVQLSAGQCLPGSPAINRVVEDLLVFVSIVPIDQAFGTLARAGPCVLRPGGGLPVVATLTLDAADVGRVQADGSLEDIIVHELAHALGFGTLWQVRGRLVNPSLPNNFNADTHFDGPEAIAAFDAIGGATYVAGGKVPVENREGGAGTRDGHWRLSVLRNELMTGYIAEISNRPLSRVTVASLADLGYVVDEAAADTFQVGPFTGPAPASGQTSGLWIGDDIAPGPIYIVGPDGRIQGTLETALPQ